MLLVLLLAWANRVPDIAAHGLKGGVVSGCDPDAVPGGMRWADSFLDRSLTCLVVDYRTTVVLDGGEPQGHAVMVEGAHQDVAIDLNGVRVRDLPVLSQQTHRLEPILVPVGSGLLRAGENHVRIELRTRDTTNAPVLLRRAYLGPQDLLEAWHRRHLELQQGGARVTLVTMVLLLILLLPIAAAGPANPSLRWYALAMVLSATYVSVFATTWRPLPSHYWATLGLIGLALSLAAFIRMSEIELGRLRSPRTFALCIAAGVLWSTGPWMPAPFDRFADLAGRLILLILLVDLGMRWWAGRDARRLTDPRWSVGGVGLLLVLGLSDSLEANLRQHWPAIAFLLHWGILYLLGLMFVALIVRLLEALREAERSQERLGIALADRTRELTAEFALRREAESARMLAEERQRIMRDMHDGVGGQLVALMTQARAGRLDGATLADEIRRTLDDLRLMIDSLDPACADLSVALGMLRSRTEGLAAGSPVELRWHTAHLPDLPPVPPSVVLHVLRIAQEAIGNALRHSGAGKVAIGATWDGHALALRIVDDGRGGALEGAGRGLVHMRERAAAIGASLAIESGPGGTRIELVVPLVSAASGPPRP